VCLSAAAAFVAVYVTFALLRHERLNSAAYDLGVKDQVIWNTAHGRPFELSLFVPPGRFVNYLGNHHFAPILAAFAPLYWLWDDVRWLLILQPLFLASAAYPIWRLGRRATESDALAAGITVTYLCYPALGFLCRFDFHQIALVVPLLLYAFYFAEGKRYGAASVCLALAMLCKEEVGLTVLAFGLFQWLARKRRAFGVTWAVVGLVGCLVIALCIMPAIRGRQTEYYPDLYRHLGGTHSEIVKNVARQPSLMLRPLVDGWQDKSAYLLKLLMPVGLVAILGLRPGLMALPALGYMFLSTRSRHYSIHFQYVSIVVPFVFLCAIEGARRLKTRPASLCVLWATFTLAARWADCPFTKPIGWPKYHEVYALEKRPNAKEFREAAAMIPAEASLGTTMAFAPHFSHRRDLRVVTMGRSELDEGLEYYLLDLVTSVGRRGLGRPILASHRR